MSDSTRCLAPRPRQKWSRNLEDRLVFKTLEVRRAPGFLAGGFSLGSPGGFSLGSPGGGVNIIYGPNAAGKTTAARALEAILWPEASQFEDAELVGEFLAAGSLWRVEVRGARSFYRRAGREVSGGPQIAPASSRERYYLGLADLLHSQNEAFAAYIARESTGGYDVGAARQALDYSDHPRAGVHGVQQARRALQEAERAGAALRQEALKLSALENELASSRAARRRLELLEGIQAYRAASGRKAKAQVNLNGFPAAMASFRPDDPEQLERLNERRRAAEQELGAVREERAGLEAKIAQGLLKSPLPPTFLPRFEAYLEEFARDSAERDHREQEASRASARARAAWEAISASVEPSTLGAISPDVLQQLSDLARDYYRIRADLQAFKRFRGLLGNPQSPDAARLDEMRQGVQYLREWSRATDPGAARAQAGVKYIENARASLSSFVLVLLALGSSCLIVAGVFLGVSVHLAWLGLLAVGLLLGWVLWRVWRVRGELFKWAAGHRVEANPRGIYQENFQKLGLSAPDAWEAVEVERRLSQLERAIARGQLEAEKSAAWAREQEAYKQVDAREIACRRERDRIVAEVGLNFDVHFGQDYTEGFGQDPAQLWLLLKNIHAWQVLRGEALASRELVEVMDEKIGRIRAGIDELLSQLEGQVVVDFMGVGPARSSDLASARGLLKALESANSTLLNDIERLKTLKNQAKHLKNAFLERNEEISAIYARLAIADEDMQAVHLLARQFEAYRAAEVVVLNARERVRAERSRLAELLGLSADEAEFAQGFEGRLAELTDLGELADLGDSSDDGALQAELDRLAQLAGRHEVLLNEVARIKTLIEAQKRSTAVEDKRAQFQGELDRLADSLGRSERRVVGAVLSDFLKEETRDASRPAVFGRAREIFSRITRGRYRLLLDEQDGPKFRAFDTVRELDQSLDELSSGTRLQLLLAVRVAFVEQQEEGIKLPLILDETLANSDDERALAMIEAVCEIARGGRQVFYFTAQIDEVRKWHQAAEVFRANGTEDGGSEGGSGAFKPHFIDLGGEYASDLVGAQELVGGQKKTALGAGWAISSAVHLGQNLTESQNVNQVEKWPRKWSGLRAPAPPEPGELSHDEYGELLGIGSSEGQLSGSRDKSSGLDPRLPPGMVHLWYLTQEAGELFSLLQIGVREWGALKNLVEAGGWAASGLSDGAYLKIAARARVLEAASSGWQIGRGRRVYRGDLEASGAVSETFIDAVSELGERLDGDARALLEALEDGQIKGFYASKRVELEGFLEAGGWLDPRAPLDEGALWNRVLAAATPDIKAGVLSVDEVRETLERAIF